MENQSNKKEQALLRPHSIDGIQEYDNKLPLWWVYLFYATIIFGVIYMLRFHVWDGDSLVDEWRADTLAIEELRESKAPHSPSEGDAATPEDLEEGKEVYASTCASCHGEKAQGVVGPNLTDDYWLHGTGTPSDIENAVLKGIPEMGMPAWESVLGAKKVQQVVSFVVTLSGTNPEGAKAPQGTQYASQTSANTASTDPQDIAEGKALYDTNCASCHREDAGGLVGPNLVDDYWLHGGSPEQITSSIASGIPEKGMISWAPILGPKKISAIVSYLISIQGSSPTSPKAPEGSK